MNLVYLFNGRLPTEKAHGIQIAKMCEAFASEGNHVTLLSSYRRNATAEDVFTFYGLRRNFTYHQVPGIDLMWIPGRIAYYIQTICSAMVLVAFAYHYRTSGATFYARDYWTLFFLSLCGLHPVAELHDYRMKKPRWYVRYLLKKSRAIIVNSRGTQELLVGDYAIQKSNILIAPNGVDLDFFKSHESKEKVREELGIFGGPIIGYTGRLETAGMDKGVSLLIEAFGMVAHKTALLYIIGGPDIFLERYREKAKSLGLEQRIIFTGQIPHACIPRYLQAMDGVVIPLGSNQHARTTSPIKLFEYMAAGKVIIASDLPALREVVDSSVVVFFQPGDAHDLAVKIDEILSDPDRATRMARRSLERAQQYSWQSRAQHIERFIESNAH